MSNRHARKKPGKNFLHLKKYGSQSGITSEQCVESLIGGCMSIALVETLPVLGFVIVEKFSSLRVLSCVKGVESLRILE